MAEETIKQGVAVDEKAISRKRQKQSDSKRAREIVLRQLLETNLGRKFVWDLLTDCNIFAQTFVPGPEGHAIMAHAEGKRSLGLKLLADITRINPQAYLTMTVENTTVDIEENNDGGHTDD